MTDRFDEQIEQGLEMSFANLDARPPLEPRYLANRSRTRRWGPAALLAGLPAILTTKTAVVLAAATFAGTGVAAKGAFTGDPNPLSWGHHQAQQQTPKGTSAPRHGSHQSTQPAEAHPSLDAAGAHDGGRPPARSLPSPAAGAPAGVNDGHDSSPPGASAKRQAEEGGASDGGTGRRHRSRPRPQPGVPLRNPAPRPTPIRATEQTVLSRGIARS
jgi:hypothetical protein